MFHFKTAVDDSSTPSKAATTWAGCDIVTEAEFEMDDLNLSTQGKMQLVLLVVNPYLVHVYWEISPQIREAINLAGKTKGVLRFYRDGERRSEEHTSELQSRFGISYAVFCFMKKNPLRRRRGGRADTTRRLCSCRFPLP